MSEETREKTFKLELEKAVDLQIPREIAAWLGRALLLYGVPFNYLVPDERMLPPESIRFFFLDPGWLQALLEGACSVGRTARREELVDQHLSNSYLESAPAAAALVRAQAAMKPEDAPEGEPRDLNWPLTGFLIRSEAVEGWQGLEMTASGVDDAGTLLDPLQPLRIDRLAPDVMLAIFNGKLTELVVKQPPEGMHFGASPTGAKNGFRRLSLISVRQAGSQAPQPGDRVDIGDGIDVPMRPGVEGVVRVREFAEQLETKLPMEAGVPFTAAEFGLQMVERPGKVIFKPRPPGAGEAGG